MVGEGGTPAPAPTFARCLGELALLAPPVAFLAQILPVVVHEILGHGLAAILLGGRFVGFRVDLDGWGVAWSILPAGISVGGRVAHLLAGSGAATIAGVLMLALASRKSSTLVARFVLLALALGCLLDGPSYMFWNSLFPARRGDFAEVLEILPSPELRTDFVMAGAVLSVGTVLWFSVMLLRLAEEWFRAAYPVSIFGRLAVLSVIVLLPGSMWFLFDWDRLTPGLGRTPGVVGLAVHVAAGGLLWVLPRRPLIAAPPTVVPRRALILAWTVAMGVFLLVWLWWSREVHW